MRATGCGTWAAKLFLMNAGAPGDHRLEDPEKNPAGGGRGKLKPHTPVGDFLRIAAACG